MKRKIMGMFGIFLAMMLLFTLLSRAADSISIAKVTTGKMERGKIPHTVTGSGKVEQNREQAVATLPGQVVKTIYVEEGQLVKAGDLLFEVDLESLKEQILNQKQEMKKEELQSNDKASSRAAEAQRDAISQSRAAEDYNVAAGKGNTAISRAAQELKEAKKKLETLEKAATGQSGADAIEETLQKTCEQKQLEYELAVKYKEELQEAIDDAVKNALSANSGQETAKMVVNEREFLTAAQTDEEMFLEPEELSQPEALQEEAGMEAVWTQETEEPETEPLGDTVFDPAWDEEQVVGEQTENVQPQTEDAWLLEQRIRQQNQPLLDEAQKEIEQKKQEKEQADAALADYQREKAAGSQQSLEEAKAQIKEEIKAKQQVYEDAVTAANDSLRSAGRSIEDASAPKGTDSTGEIDAITREQAEMQLEKLERLLEADGKVTAPIDGVIMRINLTTGDKTPDGTAMLLSDLASGNRLVVQVPSSQDKYIARNDTATVKAEGKKKEWKDLTIDTVRTNEENKDLLDVTIQLPADSLEAGEAATMTATRNSESYECCVPIQALHVEDGKYFVYVVNETESILGKELTVQRIDVTVLDKNETNAALQNGSLGSQQQIVLSSDKEISAGSRVRTE